MPVAVALDEAAEASVRWDDPADAGSTAFADQMHFPNPLSPLYQTAAFPPFEAGFTAAAREYGLPLLALRTRIRHSYYFSTPEFASPGVVPTPEQVAAIEATMRIEVGRLLARWQEEHLPRIRVLLDRLAALDVAGATAAELAAQIDELFAIQQELWTIHFRIVTPMTVAMQLFDELYADLFGGEDADAHALIVGQPSESIKAAIGLSDLAATARATGLAATILESTDREVLTSLRTSDAGRAFVDQLDRYLEVYGLRQDLFDFATPTWREYPTIALAAIRSYLRSGYDARSAHEAVARRADAAIAAARERLAAYPAAVREGFEALLAAASAAHFLQEEHNYYLDQQGLSRVRLVYVRVGERLAEAGLIDAAADIFMLELDEVMTALTSEDAAPSTDLRDTVRTRRAAMERARTLTPPPFIGDPPPPPPPSDNPLMRGNDRFWGTPPPAATAPNELRGIAGSRGTATGVARVARTLAEAADLQPGEVLVAVTTMPPWTPLFGIAAAVVTETGGPLSHCAIVAREYAIPAVVGAPGATRAIRTGQTITVDGGRGVVVLGESAGR